MFITIEGVEGAGKSSVIADAAEFLREVGREMLITHRAEVEAKIADLTNAPAGGMAGAITAALFLKRFVRKTRSWAHFDIFAWNPIDKPHCPVGGEAQAIRALERVIRQRYAG